TVLFAAGQEMDELVGIIVGLELVVAGLRDVERDELDIVVDGDGLDELVLELLVGAIAEDIMLLDVLMEVEPEDIMPLMLAMPLIAKSDIDD
ncbi:hypothetical protein LTR28_005977, partial [Elasticomyces elasticus]